MDGSFDADAWRDMDKGWFPAFDDFKLEVLDQVAEGDKVVTRYRLGGTHTGEFLNVPASGAIAWLTGTAVDRVGADKIVEHWVDMDLNGFLQRLVPQS